jgi:perosamine synthetase
MACFAFPPSGNAMPAAFLLRAGDAGFASAFADHIGLREEAVLLTDSGTSALYVAFRAVASLRGPGRIAVPAWCCPSVPQAAIQAGLKPVLVDLDPETLGYAPASLESARAHPDGLAAVLLVHFFGQAAPYPGGDWGSTLFIRDCAQDFDFNPDPSETAPCAYSFGRGKALNAGHGGALSLPSEGHSGREGAFAAACRAAHAGLPVSGARPLAKALAINVLSHPRLFWAVSGLPGLRIGATIWEAPLAFARLSPAFPRLGSACLEAYLQRRQGYRQLVARYRALAQACDPARVRHPAFSGTRPADALPTRFPLLFGDADLRERFCARVKARFGGVTRMYPSALDGLPGAPSDLAGTFPGARRVAREIATLPVAAALMGREEAFLSFLEGILREAGALRGAAAQARDWAPAPGRVPLPALFT